MSTRKFFLEISIVSVLALSLADAVSAQEAIVDAKGNVVGTLHGSPLAPWARRQMADKTWTAMRVGYSGFAQNPGDNPLYVTAATNCTGKRYMLTSLYNYGLVYKTTAASTKVFFTYPKPPFLKVTVAAWYGVNSTTGNYECMVYSAPWQANVGTAVVIDVATLRYTAPFTIKP